MNIPTFEQHVVSELTYLSYAHNRCLSPEITPERWARIFGEHTAELEARFQAEQVIARAKA